MDTIWQAYDHLMSLGDPRVLDWPLVFSPFQPLSLLFTYSLIIYFGTKLMAKRQAFDLKLFLYIYNFFQVLGSFYIFYEILTSAILSRYSLVCEPVDYSNDRLSLRMANALWLYYMTKLIDLIDTIVFVLRKKSNQITFLHVFHHFSMVCNGWAGVRYVPGGQTFFLALLNSFVHTIMYAYYGLSALGPHVQKYLWWKKYLTQMQLIQFAIVLVHTTVNLVSDCSYPKGFDIAFILYGFFIMSLFLNFYRQSYVAKKKENLARKVRSELNTNGKKLE